MPLILLLVLVSAQAAADAPTHDIQIDDYFTLAHAYDAQVSPDGATIAYVDLRWDADTKKRNSEVWVVDQKSERTTRLTFHKGSDGHPRWAPNSNAVYFSSSRSGSNQVWRVNKDGKQLRQITHHKGGVRQWQLSANGKILYYTRSVKKTADPWRSLKTRFSKLKYGHGVAKLSQLWSLNMTTWRRTKLIDAKRVVVAFDVSTDQKRIAMITRPTPELITNEGWSTVDIWDRGTRKITSLADKQWRADAPSPYGWLESPSWSRDGTALAFTIDFDGYPPEIFITTFGDAGAEKTRKLKRPGQLTVNSGVRPQWRAKSKDLLYIGERNGRTRVHLLEDATEEGGDTYPVTAGDIVVSGFSIAAKGKRIAFTMSDAKTFGDVYVTKVKANNDNLDRLTYINPQVTDWKLPTMQVVSWETPDGTKVEGMLELPYGYKKGTKLPMIVYIHGGPASSSKFRLRFWSYGRTHLAARGYAVFAPNYRGSTGYGDKFLTDLIGRKNDIDVTDILTGVDAMVERGIADPNRLGVMGWSNGGYLTNCVITHTNRFKAASSGAGVFDVAMQWSIEDTPGHVINYQKGLPWERAAGMIKASPLYDVNKVKTPTIIHVGENDPRCPQEHSRAMHRALHTYLKVDTELVVYPGEGHSLSKYEHRKAHMVWDLEWFDKYLPVKVPKDSK